MPILFGSDIELPRDPTAQAHAATKRYVDTTVATKADAVHTHTHTQITGLGTAAVCDTGTAAGMIPVLDPTGKLSSSVVPAIAITDTFVVASQAAMLALTVQRGDVAIRTDENKSYILREEPASVAANWQELLAPLSAITSVNGKTGVVVLTAADVGAIPTTEKAKANGVATLDASTKIPIAQIPTQTTVTNSSTAVPTGAAVYSHTNSTSAHSATSTPTVARMAMWDGNKRLKSALPAANDDVATKEYVDSLTTGSVFRSTFTGNSTATSFPVTHNLGSEEVNVTVFKTVSGKPVPIIVTWEATSANAISVVFSVAPSTGDAFIVKVRA